MKLDVSIRRIFNEDTALKAVCSVTLDDEFVIHNVKVIKSKNNTFLTMPCETFKDSNGKYQYKDIVHPVTSDARKKLESAVLAAYEAKISEIAATDKSNE